MCTIDHGDQCTEALEVSNHEVHFLKCFDGQFNPFSTSDAISHQVGLGTSNAILHQWEPPYRNTFVNIPKQAKLRDVTAY